MNLKTGLLFGSFDPVHVGHLIIAEYMLHETDLERIWFVVSPQNPHKKDFDLTQAKERLHMVNIAIENKPGYSSCDIEFQLPKPHYTYKTLKVLNEQYPEGNFVLIMGGDNLEYFNEWQNYKDILDMMPVYAYPRYGHQGDKFRNHPRVNIVEAPRFEISSSFIRESIKNGKTPGFMLTPGVLEYIENNRMYR
jgi:nicotinate-nucleotide adenylyltransferase